MGSAIQQGLPPSNQILVHLHVRTPWPHGVISPFGEQKRCGETETEQTRYRLQEHPHQSRQTCFYRSCGTSPVRYEIGFSGCTS